MTKAEIKILERIFESEIESALKGTRFPAQFRGKKLLQKLESDGYVMRVEETLGGRFPVLIKGWALTELGRMTYCFSCERYVNSHVAKSERVKQE